MQFHIFYAVITKETIDRIMETARVEEVVGDFVSLKKRGSNHIGLALSQRKTLPSTSLRPKESTSALDAAKEMRWAS